jgi:hypothetical protein
MLCLRWGAGMIEACDVQVCGHKCCIYIRGKLRTPVEFKRRIESGEITQFTRIHCLSSRGSKIARDASVRAGFYLGLPYEPGEAEAEESEEPLEGYVYDTRTHRYLRKITGDDARAWLQAFRRD